MNEYRIEPPFVGKGRQDDWAEASARLQALLQVIPDLVYFKDAQGKNISVNRAFADWVGRPVHEIEGRSDGELFAQELAESCRRSDEMVLTSGQPVRFQEHYSAAEGGGTFFDTIKAPLRDAQGSIVGLVGLSRDVTAWVEANAALERRLREMTLLNRVTTLIASSTDMRQALHHVCVELSRFLQVPQAGFALLDRERTGAEVIADHHPPDVPSALGSVLPVVGNPSMAYILERKSPLVVEDAQHNSRLAAVHEIMRRRRVESILIMPIVVNDEVIGTLGFDAFERRTFPQPDVELVQNVANQVGQMLARRQAEEVAQTKTRQQERLIEAAHQLATSLDVREVLTRIGTGVREIVHAESCAIYMLNADGQTLDPVVAIDPEYEQEILAVPIQVDSSLTGQAVCLRRGLIFNDAASDPNAYQIPGTPLDEEERVIVVPMVADERVLGAMCVSRMGDRFSPEDLALAETFAAYASTALKNAQTYRDLQREVEERRRTEMARRESEERYRSTIDAMDDLIHVVDRGLHILLCNQALRRAAAESDSPGDPVGRHVMDLFPFLKPSVRDEYQHVLETGRPLTTEESVQLEERTFWTETRKIPILDAEGRVYRIITIVHDVTERRLADLERQDLADKLERARRMESLGVLAGGVAHDLNNLLGPLVAYPELILMDLPSDSPVRQDVLQIGRAAERAAAVVQDLLTLARRGMYRMAPLNLNHIVEQYLGSPTFVDLEQRHPGVRCQADLDPELLYLSGSASHLSKVIMNLIVNAFEALPKGGEIAIRTSCESLDRPHDGYERVEAGDYVVLRVRDNGVGIEEKDLERIFEPFYTKKEMGRSGSGLGLAVVWGVVHDHHGRIDVWTDVGCGTEFVVYFPVTQDVPDTVSYGYGDYRGRERVLVVDDLPEQRKLASRLLAALGYQVATVESGREAAKYIQEAAVDILVLDMIMEEDFDGLDTLRAVLDVYAAGAAAAQCEAADSCSPRVVIASGYSETERVKEAQALGAGPFVKKPYTLDRLGQAVRRELDRGQP
jgi:PAS domain S-box-containing protein